MTMLKSELSQLVNIGATIENYLHEAGIHTKKELAEVGPVGAYKRICARHPEKTIPVCYYLYSLQGALMGIPWRELPEELKVQLRNQVTSE
jgi:DNA transformation protein